MAQEASRTRPRRRRSTGSDPPEPPGPQAALDVALGFLGSRPRTRWELERRLRRAGTDDAVTAATLERLESMGHLDDAAFVRWWIEQRDRHAPRGTRMIEAELRQHGVARDVIEAYRVGELAIESAPEDDVLPATDAERARAALDRHLRGRPMPSDARAVQRIGMFLMRRGFDPETVRATLRGAGAGGATGEEPSGDASDGFG